MLKSTDWRLVRDRGHKRVWMRYDLGTDNIEIMEEWLNTFPLKQAEQERELYERGANRMISDSKPLAVIPQSVVAQSLKEGWYHDDERWRRWMNDGDNSRLRITRGNV